MQQFVFFYVESEMVGALLYFSAVRLCLYYLRAVRICILFDACTNERNSATTKDNGCYSFNCYQ